MALHLGADLKAARKAKDKSQQAVAQAIGIDRKYISMMENDVFRGSLSMLIRYLDFLELELQLSPMERRLPTFDEIDDLFDEDTD